MRRRSDEAKAEVLAINSEVVTIAERAIADARGVGVNARQGLRRNAALATGKTLAILAELERTAVLVERVAAQTRVRLASEVPDGSTRVVSLHDPDARPIAKGRLGRPVEFGYKAQVVNNVDGDVVDHSLHVGNPPDAPLPVPPSPGSSPASDAPRGQSPRIVATAKPRSIATSRTSACSGW